MRQAKKKSYLWKAIVLSVVLGIVYSIATLRPSLGYMNDTAANRRTAAMAFLKALEDNPNKEVVRVYVFTNHGWRFFQFDRKAQKAYFGSGSKQNDVCGIWEERVKIILKGVIDYPYGTTFDEAFKELANNANGCVF